MSIVEKLLEYRLAAPILFVLTLCVSPIIVPIYLVAVVYRNVVKWIIWRRFSDLGPYPCGYLLEPIDVVSYPGNVHGLNIAALGLVLKTVPDLEYCRREILEKWVDAKDPDDENRFRFPRFRMFVDSFLGLLFWNYDSQFDINRHVRMVGDNIVGERQLKVVLGKVYSMPIAAAGKWELVLIPFRNDSGKENCVCLVRSHHAIAAAIAYFRIIMDTVMSSTQNGDLQASPQHHNHTSFSHKMAVAAKAAFYLPHYAVHSAVTMTDCEHALHRHKIPAGQPGQIATWSEPRPLAILRPVRAATKCSVNDIYISCVLGAYRRYFVARKSEIPSRCNVTIPVSLESPLQPPQLKNNVTIITAILPLDISDPLERLQAVKAILGAKKNSPDFLINKLVIGSLYNTFPYWITEKMALSPDITAIASNVPGPSGPVKLFGADVDFMIGAPPTVAKIGVVTTFFSFIGSFSLLINVERYLESNQDRLDDMARYFSEEIDLLCDLCKNDI